MSALLSARPHLEKAVFGFGMVTPVLALPQVYKVWALDSTGGFSLITLGAALIMALLMTAWGLLEQSMALWIPSFIWIAINFALIVGVIRSA
jgi:uncharacterized protein with PQ loop repeat